MFLETYHEIYAAKITSLCTAYATCPIPRKTTTRATVPGLPDNISDWFLNKNDSSVERCNTNYKGVIPDGAPFEMIQNTTVEDTVKYV